MLFSRTLTSLRRPVIFAVVAGCALANVAIAHGAGKIEDVEINTAVASEAEIRAARSIENYLDGDSRREPNVCKDKNGGPLTRLEKQRDASVPIGNGISVSPGGYALKGLLPDTTYRACVIIRSLTDEPETIGIDDVDLQAAEGVDAGVALIDNSQGVGTWLVPSTRTFLAQKGFTYNLPFIIRTPKVFPAGTVVGGIRVIRAAPAVTGAGAKTQFAVNQRIYISSPGGRRNKLELEDVSSNRIISGKPGQAAFHARFTIRNNSDYLTTYQPTLKITGLGRTVAKQELSSSSLLPNGADRQKIEQQKLPWIGIYHPSFVIQTSEGPITEELPMVIVLPPLIYTIALILAILFPIVYFIWRWRRRRREWIAYLAAEMEAEGTGDAEDSEAVDDEYWDPAQR